MKSLKWFLSNFEEIVSGIALSITVLVIGFNVIMRYFFSASMNWAEELSAIAFAWVIFIGSAACYKRYMHIGIDVLVNIFPAEARRKLELATAVFLAGLNVYLFILSLEFSISAWEKPTAVLLWPYTVVDGSAALGFAFMIWHSIRHAIDRIRRVPRASGASASV
jgi:TRAP-type transport system small permease protein